MSAADSPGGPVAVLERWFAAFNAHDVDALCALTDPAVQVIPVADAETAPPGTTYHGHEGMRTLLRAGFARWPKLHVDHGPLRVTGDRVTADLEFVLDDGVTPPQVRAVICQYRIADGRIRRARAYERGTARERSRAMILSPREREVLSLLAEGQTVPEIAEALVLSPLTVRTHVRNAKDKLRARTTAHAVAIALDGRELDV